MYILGMTVSIHPGDYVREQLWHCRCQRSWERREEREQGKCASSLTFYSSVAWQIMGRRDTPSFPCAVCLAICKQCLKCIHWNELFRLFGMYFIFQEVLFCSWLVNFWDFAISEGQWWCSKRVCNFYIAVLPSVVYLPAPCVCVGGGLYMNM